MSLFPFPPARDAGQSVSRIALIRNAAEIERLAGEIVKRENSRQAIESELVKVPAAEADLAAAIDRDSRTLLSRLADGLGAALGSFGRAASEIDGRLAASRHAASVGQRALSTLDGEIAALEAQMAEARTVQPELVAAATAEACQDVVDDYAEALDRVQAGIIRLGALEKFLNITRIGRVVAIVPDFAEADFSEQTIVANGREIAKAHEALVRFAEALSHDPRAPVSLLNFPPIDTSPDPSEVYSDLSAPERARIDANFTPLVTRQRPTEDSIALAEAIAARAEQFHSLTA
jgi:hypothetical protein